MTIILCINSTIVSVVKCNITPVMIPITDATAKNVKIAYPGQH